MVTSEGPCITLRVEMALQKSYYLALNLVQ